MHDKCRTVDTALKNQLVSSFDNPYISMMKNAYTGCAIKTTMELIQHLYKNYAQISATDIAENNKRLRAPYNAEDLIESLVRGINECANFYTAARETVSQTQIVRIVYGLVYETGQ